MFFKYQYHINFQYQFYSCFSSNFETGIRAASRRNPNSTTEGPDEDDKLLTEKKRQAIEHEALLCKFKNIGFSTPEELVDALQDVTDTDPAVQERAKTVIKEKLQGIRADAFIPEVTLASVKRFSAILGQKLKPSVDVYNLIVDADDEYYTGMHVFRILPSTPKYFFLTSNEEQCYCLLEH